MFQYTGRLAAVCALVSTLTGCATIIHGSSQEVQVNSAPPGATVFVNDDERGTTPLTLDLEREERYLLRLEMDGYVPQSRRLARRADTWAIIGFVFGGPISIGIDWITGALYMQQPGTVFVRLDEPER